MEITPKHYKIHPDEHYPAQYVVETYYLSPVEGIISWNREYAHLTELSDIIRNFEKLGYIADAIEFGGVSSR